MQWIVVPTGMLRSGNVLPGLIGAQALAAMERIRAAVQGLGLPHAKATVAGVVTISIGVATTHPGTGQTPQRLSETADQMLYAAKNAGKNTTLGARL